MSLDSDPGLDWGQSVCWKKPPIGAGSYGVNACRPQTGVLNYFFENLVRQTHDGLWAETSNKETAVCVCVCV